LDYVDYSKYSRMEIQGNEYMNDFIKGILDEKNNHFIFILLAATLIFIATYSYVGVPTRPGLDPSYQFAFNYFFANNVQIGKEVLFSFGPLGFLLWPEPIGKNLYIAYLVSGVFLFLFIFLSLYLNSISKQKTNTFSFFIIIFMTFFIASQIGIHNLLIFIPVILLILHKIKGNVFYLIFASMFVGLAFMVKASAGIIGLSILFSYWVLTYFEVKKITFFLISSITMILTFLLIWFLLYQNLSGIIDYLIATLELSRGNSSAMTINPSNNWWLFALFFFSYSILPFILKENNIFFLYSLMMVPTVVFFKYAFARADSWHIVYFLIFLGQFLYLVLIISTDIKKKHVILSTIIFILFVLFTPGNPNLGAAKRFFIPIANNLSNKPFVTFEVSHNNLVKESNVLLKKINLEKEVLEIIQQNTIDIYPWEASYVAANMLNWKSRPVFQSYITYTPYLDMKNADFYSSTKSSYFILWIKKHWGGEVGSIDGRYLLNDEPLTLYQILKHYKPVYETTNILLLKKSEHELLGDPAVTQESTHQWDTWIEIPNNTLMNSIHRAKVNIERTLFQKIKKLLYKEFEVYITYKFENGEEKKYRIVVDNAKNGLWINPFQNKLLDYDWSNKVIAIKFTHSRGDYFKNIINIKWESIKINASSEGL